MSQRKSAPKEQAVSTKEVQEVSVPVVCEIRIPSEARNEEMVEAFTQLCHKYNLTAKIRGESKRGAPRSNPEGEITIAFGDIELTKSLKDARTARKWLRKHNLSVTTATKQGSTWTFTKISQAAKLALTQKVKPTAKSEANAQAQS